MSFLVELLGEKLISRSQVTCCATDELTNKIVALFFAASWCPRSQLLTRNLIKEYQRAKIKENNLPFEIIFISLDNDEESAEEFYRSMPWKAMPFSNDPQLQSLLERYDLKDIPSLIIFNMNGDMLTAEGVEEFELNPSIDLWINGKTLFWTQASQEGTEDIWTNVRCHSCHMKPIIGERWICIDRECELNLCSQCYRTNTHPHPLVALLSPQKNYSIKELFDGSTLIDANRHPVPFQSIENKYLGLYFSALWSEPDEGINENMVEIYTKINELNIPFDIIFISADENPTKFDEHFRSITWKALSFDDRMAMLRLKVYFQVQEIPKMLVLKPDGQLLTKSGLQQIEQCGIEAIEMWCNNGVHSLSADYTWFSVVCDGCGMEPLVGARYYCSTCENYDLCLKCQNQGHSHPLTLIEPPSK